jgi:hypothetical protein
MALLSRTSITALLTLGLCGLVGETRAAGPLTEAQVRAALLYNFASFTEWPSAAVPSQSLVMCVLGADAVGDALREIRGRPVHGQPVEIRKMEHDGDPRQCHLLYVPADSDGWPRLVGSLQSSPVLTVGEHEQFLRLGGMVRLYPEGGRIRFTINVTRSQRANLRISSKLLALAGIVKDPP